MPDSLDSLHRKIDRLTDQDGEYAVVCPRSGKRPVPIKGESFPTPEVAADAVDLVVEYRKRLREADPHLEAIPIVACEAVPDPLSLAVSSNGGDSERSPGGRDSTSGRDSANRRGHPPAGPSGRMNASGSSETVTLSGTGEDEWLRLTDVPVVRLWEGGEPLDDAVVGLELNAQL